MHSQKSMRPCELRLGIVFRWQRDTKYKEKVSTVFAVSLSMLTGRRVSVGGANFNSARGCEV